MTREEARKAAEVMLAYANGEEIEALSFGESLSGSRKLIIYHKIFLELLRGRDVNEMFNENGEYNEGIGSNPTT